MLFTDSDVAEVRHVVQRILVPCVFVIGLLGNSVSIYVLTRRRMRCTTNIYLTALAITDIIYLTMALLLSLKHYEYVQRKCKLYWMYYGIVVWLCDACAYNSIYIAVCFTIERFIAIRYPLKRQTFCTESLAKKVITGVALFCLFSTVSTAFEHEYSVRSKWIDSVGEPCNLTIANAPNAQLQTHPLNSITTKAASTASLTTPTATFETETMMPATAASSPQQLTLSAERTTWLDYNDASLWPDEGSGGAALDDARERERPRAHAMNTRTTRAMHMHMTMAMDEYNRKNATIRQLPLEAHTLNIPSITTAALTLQQPDLLPLQGAFLDNDNNAVTPSILHMQMTATLEGELRQHKHVKRATGTMQTQSPAQPDRDANDVSADHVDSVQLFNVTEYCQNFTYFYNTPSSLAQNALYTRIWYFFTLFTFVLIPLCVLSTFNCFLIMLVRRSKSLRGEMTNASSMRRQKRKSHTSSVSQENRVTVTLIAVVLLFIICQLPWAIYLIVSDQMEIEPNLEKIIGNIFNFLAAINAAANFFLYCVLSDKYRKTVRELITGYKYRRQHTMHTNTSIYHNNNNNTMASTANGSRRYRPAATSSLVIK